MSTEGWTHSPASPDEAAQTGLDDNVIDAGSDEGAWERELEADSYGAA